MVRRGWNSRLLIRSSQPSGRRATKRWKASRPPASSTGTASHFSTTIRLPAMRDSRSLNSPSAAAKNRGPITRSTSTSSGTSTLTGERRVICAMRRINSSEASTMPTLMAITISNSTVSDIQISITIMSSFGARRSRLTTLCASLMFQATISSSAAMAESGSHESSGARISSAMITSRE